MSAPTIAAPTTAPVAPPRAWFADPKLRAVTPLTVDPSGRVFGHLASWRECHMESASLGRQCVTAPRSRTGYARFTLGAVRTAEGDTIPTGAVVMGAPHANPAWSLAAALDHYSNSARAVADVAVGEDSHGIWIAGALRPTVTPAQVRELRASPLSGDWRTFSGHLELVAALAVNTPGFAIPRPRALIASAGGMRAVVGIGSVAPTSEARFEYRAMRVKIEGLRRWRDELSSFELADLDAVIARQADHALIASMSQPTALVQPWEGPVGFEGVATGDGRLIAPEALNTASLPMPLRWAASDVGGHDGAVVVGRIDSLARGAGGSIIGRGVLDLGSPEGREIARQIAGNFAGGVSLDLDSTDASPVKVGDSALALTTSARIRAATVVAVPAFEGARIRLVGGPMPGAPATPPDPADADCGCDDTPTTGTAPTANRKEPK